MSVAVRAGTAARLAAAALALTLPPGCTQSREVVGYYRPAAPKPRQGQPPPPDARADAVVVNVRAAPEDTDGNGYPDLIQATAYLFDTRYAMPIREDGAFVFLLYAAGESAARTEAQPLRQWRFADQKLAEARARTSIGPCYLFRLSLLEEGTDVLAVPMADLACRFEPADGRPPTRASGVATISLGHHVALRP